MPVKQPNAREIEALRKLYLKAETDIINEIGRLRSLGYADYHLVAALERIQGILQSMQDEAWKYVPRMIEKMFYVRVPEARNIVGATPESQMAAYTNARVLTPTQQDIAQRLTTTLMAQLSDAAMTVSTLIGEVLLGSRRDDAVARMAIEYTARIKATGEGIRKAIPDFVQEMTQNGVTAFVDRAGRKWALHTYADMVTRTTSRQADVLAVLTADPEQDLYAISSHGTTCAICAPLEGRVYSRSGTDPVYPPLSAAFGKVDRAGGDDLSNTWLNIHPNCLHQLLPWTPAGRTPEEIEEIKRKSSFETNPPTVDPRTKAQVEAYRNKERARAKWLADYRQWERYRVALGDKAPKTFATFQKHKIADDNKYKGWMKQYRDINRGD